MHKNINMVCDCGCGNGFLIQFRFDYDDDDMIYISTVTSGFYAQQCSFRKRLARRIKSAWFMLLGKEFYLHEIVLNKEQWSEFVNTVNKVKM